MLFRKRPSGSSPSGAAAAGRLFGGRTEETPSSVIGRNTRFRGEIRGAGSLVIRGQVEGSLLLRDQLTVEPGGWVKASVSAPQMILGGAAEGEIRIRETLTLQSSGMLEGSTESGALLVAEGAILKGIIRRSGFGADNPPDQSTP